MGEIRRAAAEAPMLDAETERDYLARIHTEDDPVAMHHLLASHQRLVVSIAQKYARRGMALEDLVAEGNLGLVEAVRRFDRSRTTRFATYAAWWVRALVRRAALENRRIVRCPSTRNARRVLGQLRTAQQRLSARLGHAPSADQVAAELRVPVEDVTMVEAALAARDVSYEDSVEVGAREGTPEHAVAEHQAREHNARLVRAAIAQLGERERLIVERRLLAEDRSRLADVGAALGLSRERVRQLEVEARVQLRAALRDEVA